MVEKSEKLLQENSTGNNLNLTTPNIPLESPQETAQIYSEAESLSIKEYINIFQTKLFLTQMEVCEVVQDYSVVSKYNLKRNQLRQKDRITFVCSCNSKKPSRNTMSLINDENINHLLDNNSGFLEKAVEGNEEEEDCNGINSNYNYNYNINYINRSRRHNEAACKYRLRFKYDNQRKGYLYFNTSYLIHNHAPECYQKNKTELEYESKRECFTHSYYT